jgi:LysR family transcriptional regulator, transcriptional activator for dmlA
MNKDDLQLVLSIKSAGSLAAAATELGVNAPSVTKRLAALEAQLGVKLFYRTTRRVSPTAEGEMLCERATGLLAAFVDTEEALRSQAHEPAGRIRLAATFGFGRIWLGAALAQFHSQYPQVSIDLQLTENLPDLNAEGYDAAVWLWAPQEARTGEWSATLLAHNERVLVASPAYLRLHGTPTSLQELASHACLQVRESYMPSSQWLLSKSTERKAQAVKVSGRLSSNSGELVRDWCLNGQGIMLRSLWDVAPHLASGQLVQVLAQYAMRDANIQWLAPFRAQTPKRVSLLKSFLQAQYKSPPWQ